MPLGSELGLSPSNIMLDGDPAPPPQKGAEPSIFSPYLSELQQATSRWARTSTHISEKNYTTKLLEIFGRPFVQELSSSWDGRPWPQ